MAPPMPLPLTPSLDKVRKSEHGKQSREWSEKELRVAFAVIAKLQLGVAVEINSIAVYIWFFLYLCHPRRAYK